MNFPTDLKYTKTHEWVKIEGPNATIGITDYAQDYLGEVVFVELPLEGDSLTAGESIGSVESIKAVSDIDSPVTGTAIAVNEKLADEPGLVNSDPYGAWMVKVENFTDTVELMDATQYEAFCKEEK